VNDILLSPENALNMLRIMQEAFHNAIKHSGCTNITIEITSDECVQLRIIDDGRGFILQKDNLGNGLKNIQQRAKANGWQLKIESMLARGTSIELCM
jgi:signal transduction histidine kinase